MNPFFPKFLSAFYHSKETKQRQILTFQAKCDLKYSRGIVIIGVTKHSLSIFEATSRKELVL